MSSIHQPESSWTTGPGFGVSKCFKHVKASKIQPSRSPGGFLYVLCLHGKSWQPVLFAFEKEPRLVSLVTSYVNRFTMIHDRFR